MKSGRFIFSHILRFLPIYEFDQCVDRYNGNYRSRSFSCYEQFICLAFAQLTGRASLRDIEICLRSMTNKLYHIGIRGKISRSTLADANESRDWNIYHDFAQILIAKAQKLYAGSQLSIDIGNELYALDSSTIDLSLSVFPWAKSKASKGAIKLHTLLDLRGNIPSFIIITDGKVSDVKIMDDIFWEAGSIYLMDRGYLDFARLYKITTSGAFFVTRLKKKIKWKRLCSQPADKENGIICDQIIILESDLSYKNYPTHLRRVKYYDKELNKRLVFLTNNFILSSLTIAKLYKQRWQVELFFKWIKQHLKIKSFYGTSENAVKTQIWIAISVYLLIAIIKKTLKLEESLYTLSQIFSLSLFERVQCLQDFIKQDCINSIPEDAEQLSLLGA